MATPCVHQPTRGEKMAEEVRNQRPFHLHEARFPATGAQRKQVVRRMGVGRDCYALVPLEAACGLAGLRRVAADECL